ncbi:hypothetical protein DES53_10828 [Roseimicrobium gellanilyticum]|uniref:Uncharacterized protein n=1 Tax=Roseimicrobium gellanilyticum TaxID=748857 RepID=A0A366HCY3_9BACT|nr:hypothetical protein [Roseimicrobium gellanilyticum]RBP40322.1 hypothetical protein DES53_10828 [Roseimicrobium gellanilyticum]
MQHKQYKTTAIVSIVIALLSLGLAVLFPQHRVVMAFVLGGWAIIPPVYFFFELHHAIGKNIPGEVDRIKASQEAAAKIWAGVAAALGFIFIADS